MMRRARLDMRNPIDREEADEIYLAEDRAGEYRGDLLRDQTMHEDDYLAAKRRNQSEPIIRRVDGSTISTHQQPDGRVLLMIDGKPTSVSLMLTPHQVDALIYVIERGYCVVDVTRG